MFVATTLAEVKSKKLNNIVNHNHKYKKITKTVLNRFKSGEKNKIIKTEI